LELDGLRAIAIALVMGCHYRAFADNFGHVTQFGWVGVDIFFVLSGYLITTILLRMKTAAKPYRTFYARRIRRIFPPYYLVLGVVLGLAALSGGPAEHGAAYYAFFLPSFHGTWGLLQRAGAVLMGRSPVPPLLALPWLPFNMSGYGAHSIGDCLGHMWSLSVEEWFYVIWAPLVLATSRKVTGMAIGAITAIALLLRWWGFLGFGWYFQFATRLDTLAVGAALAIWYSRREQLSDRWRRRGDAIVSAASIAAVLALAALLFRLRPVLGHEIRDSPLFAAFGTPLIGIATAGVIAWVLRHASSRHPVCRVLRLRPMVFVGTVSYTVYLVHVPLYFVARGVAHGSDWPSAGLAILLSLTAAAISWEYIEAPLLERK
jgi:peptidoglycan/LPS O-acetylase OafA/YrhL